MSSQAAKILMVVTSHGEMGGTGKPTGLWFEELAAPYYEFVDAGADVDIVSIAGGAVPIDPRSIKPEGENDPVVDRFLADADAMAKIKASAPVESVSENAYDAIFLPGGHGTMWDLPGNRTLATLIGGMWEANKVVAAVCHGPAGLVDATDRNGRQIVDGRRLTGFSDAEEEAVGLTSAVPFLLETRLRSLGARYESGPNFQPFAVADGNLVTGQNPPSSKLAAELTLKAIAVLPQPAAAE